MTTLDHFSTAPQSRDWSVAPALITGVLLLVLMGGAALMAPAQPAATLDWHGNVASAR